MNTVNEATIAARLAACSADLAELEATHMRAVYDLEDAMAFRPHEEAPARKLVAAISSKIEMALSMQRGLQRRAVLEELAELGALADEGDRISADGNAAYSDHVARTKAAEAVITELYESEPAYRANRDRGWQIASIRREKLNKFLNERADDIAAAEALVARESGG